MADRFFIWNRLRNLKKWRIDLDVLSAHNGLSSSKYFPVLWFEWVACSSFEWRFRDREIASWTNKLDH